MKSKLKYIFSLMLVHSIAKAICDVIQFKNGGKYLYSDWWLAKGDYVWYKRTFLEKYFFSFISDGWHLFDSTRVMSFYIVVSLFISECKFSSEIKRDYDNNRILLIIFLSIIGYSLNGIIFEIVYNLL